QRAAHTGVRLEGPVGATRFGIQRVDGAGLRADEQTLADHRGRAARLAFLRQAVGPGQAQAGDVLHCDAAGLGALEAGVAEARTPAVPLRGGLEVEGLHRALAQTLAYDDVALHLLGAGEVFGDGDALAGLQGRALNRHQTVGERTD